jgi:glycine hydroxymethyltransferase
MSDICKNAYFTNIVDEEIRFCIEKESARQGSSLQLIASENFVSKEVLLAQGSIFTNKYAEGYPSKRYYSGCIYADDVENIAIYRLKKLFGANYANVQPHSGSQANQAAFLALLKPGDKILGMSMGSGGHLTHGSFVNMSGKWFQAATYQVNKDTFCLDYDEIEEQAVKHRPNLIIAGYSSYNKAIDFSKFREIADKVGAYLLADIAHISGIIAAGYHQSPLPYADVVTSTTHKTLRGPRGGIIMTNDEKIAKKIDSALFPGLQGGPFLHIMAAKAVAFLEALQPSFKEYIKQVLSNANALSKAMKNKGFATLGDTQNHIVLLDLRAKNITGKAAAEALESAGIIVNKNVMPFDTVSPFITSGIRMGTPACTTKGMKEDEFCQIAEFISIVLNAIANKPYNNVDFFYLLSEVKKLCQKFSFN